MPPWVATPFMAECRAAVINGQATAIAPSSAPRVVRGHARPDFLGMFSGLAGGERHPSTFGWPRVTGPYLEKAGNADAFYEVATGPRGRRTGPARLPPPSRRDPRMLPSMGISTTTAGYVEPSTWAATRPPNTPPAWHSPATSDCPCRYGSGPAGWPTHRPERMGPEHRRPRRVRPGPSTRRGRGPHAVAHLPDRHRHPRLVGPDQSVGSYLGRAGRASTLRKGLPTAEMCGT